MQRAIKPGVVALAWLTALAAWLYFAVPRSMRWSPARLVAEEIIITVSSLAAYAIALHACRLIASEYDRGTWMRWSWVAFGGNAAFSIARHMVDNSLPKLIWPGYWQEATISLLRQSAVILSLLCLLIGIVASWLAFHRLGLGFRMLPRDKIALALVFVLVTGILCFRERLTEAQSPFRLAWYLQQATQVLLAAAAAASVPLHRLCVQMGGGRLAATLRWMLLYAGGRCAVVFATVTLPDGWETVPAATLAYGVVFYSMPWVFAMATATRGHMAAQAMNDSRRGGD
jgi:hypothetical protein